MPSMHSKDNFLHCFDAKRAISWERNKRLKLWVLDRAVLQRRWRDGLLGITETSSWLKWKGIHRSFSKRRWLQVWLLRSCLFHRRIEKTFVYAQADWTGLLEAWRKTNFLWAVGLGSNRRACSRFVVRLSPVPTFRSKCYACWSQRIIWNALQSEFRKVQIRDRIRWVVWRGWLRKVPWMGRWLLLNPKWRQEAVEQSLCQQLLDRNQTGEAVVQEEQEERKEVLSLHFSWQVIIRGK